MKKKSTLTKIVLRALLGAPVGLAISTIVTIIVSVCIGDGSYYAVVPSLVDDCGSELNAVLIQTASSLLYGAAWGGASVIWELEKWSLFKQTIVHLVICSAATFPIAYFMRWMPREVLGIVIYFAIFFSIYLGIWLSQYFSMKARLKELNMTVRSNK